MSSTVARPVPAPVTTHPTRVRHVVLWLTVAAYMITYMDRVVISAAVPYIQKEFGFSLVTMGWILSSFYAGYSLFQVPGGWIGDRIGPRRALALIVCWWSFFTAATVLCWNAASMVVCRFLFGAGESGAFPIATRSLSRWMLPSERGFAQSITHAGSRLGAALTPPFVVWLITLYNWRLPFVLFGSVGLVWAAVWFYWYRDTPREHKSVNAAELSLIHDAIGERSRTTKSVPWRAILRSRTLWYLSAMYFCYGYAFAVYVLWFPTYLRDGRGFNLTQMGIYASLPLLAGTVGDLAGGWLSDVWLKRTGHLARSRRTIGFAGFAVAAAAIIPAALTSDPMTSVWFSCLAMFGLEFTVGVSWAVPLDIGGDYAGSVSAVMNTCGNLGGTISPTVLGYLVREFGWEEPFLVSSVMCAVAALLYLRIDASRKVVFSESQ
jgi:MFS transporter, ACS family, glucarate transporter